MDDEKLKYQIGANIASYRKSRGMTQAKLAEQLNYTDKAVSKWERGESVPDVMTLVALARQFGVTVDELVRDPNALPEETGRVQQAMGHVVEKTLKRKADKRIILGLSSVLVWSVALFIYVILASLDISKSWLAFFYAVPADAIVMLSLRSAWRDFRWNRILISMILWGTLVSLYVSLQVVFSLNVWRILLLGIPGQIAIFLWFRLFRGHAPVEEEHGQAESEKEDP